MSQEQNHSSEPKPSPCDKPPSVPLQPVVRPYCEKTHRNLEVTGPDKDNEVCIEWDRDSTMIWLSREDAEMILARWPNPKVTLDAHSASVGSEETP